MHTKISFKEKQLYQPVAECLIRELIVPSIYFEPMFPGSDMRPDIVAIDRAGTGDLHVVEVKNTLDLAFKVGIKQVLSYPGHYHWIACPFSGVSEETALELISQKPLYPKNGAGKVGVIEVVLMSDQSFGANIKIRAERFLWGKAEEFIRKFISENKPAIKFE